MPVELANPDGSTTPYETVSERLPSFLEAYPPSDGWRIVKDHTFASAEKAEIARLWEKALEAGRDPKELGLPPVAGQVVIFGASLWSPDERLLANATSLKSVVSAKDWEAGETAAFQRLMATLGFGGSTMDADEAHDRASSASVDMGPGGSADTVADTDQAQNPQVAVPQREQSAPEATEQPTESQEQETQREPVDAGEPPEPEASEGDAQSQDEQAPTEQQAQPETEPEPTPAPQSKAKRRPASQNKGDQPPRPQLLSQLKQAASLAGEDVPEVNTQSEAKAEIRRLQSVQKAAKA